MSDERRYSEQEIAAIFERAAEDQEAAQRAPSSSEGLTLAELQQIGKETGITPAFIARAAASLDHAASIPPTETYFGLPVSVGRTIDMPGPLSDADWDRLVVDLRKTFRASGELRLEGSIREWRNGNLHVLAEPTESGHRLHFQTRKGDAQQSLTLSLFFLVIGAVFLTLLAAKGESELGMMVIMSLFVAAGLGGVGLTAYRLPRWAAERERQMEAIAARAAARMEVSPVGGVPAAEPVHETAPADRLDLDTVENPVDGAQVSQRRSRT